MRDNLPSGTVTFLFTDVEGSTRLLEEIGEAGYEEALYEHRSKLRETFARHGGVEVDTQGDAFFYAFPEADEAVTAASEAQMALAEGPISVRMGLHTGEPRLRAEGYVGREVHRGARIASAGHGGQVLLSQETRELVAVEVTDLGEHRLKDFSEPIWIYQLGHERFPPLKTISNTNLPRPASSFVGRERELQELLSLLSDSARLVTLTGPGGTGKTRLAIEAASELVPEFKAGVFWVSLAALRDPALVPDTIAQTLGVKDGLAEHVGERELLLLLDNLEQLVDAAPELAELVETCPNLRLLVTSRELLRVRGEVEYAVPPLAEAEAVELFSARSGLDPDETIAELCRRLDDLPLALELAAARTSVLSPAQILERLARRLDLLKGGRDAEARQQTLRAAIEWSYDLLDAEEQRLFARLAVFAGGCTLEAAEEVAEADLDVLQSLVQKSLLRHTDERFWMLETIREYARERLEASTEADDLRRRHADYILALVEQAETELREFDKEAQARIDREHANVGVALDAFEATGESELAMRLAGAAFWYWSAKGHLPEGRPRVDALLKLDSRPTAARAKALIAAADLAVDAGDYAAIRTPAEEALALMRRQDDPWGIAYSLFMLAMAAAHRGEFERGQALFEQCEPSFRELGEKRMALFARRQSAWMRFEQGDVAGARELHEDVVREARAAGYQGYELSSLGALAEYALYEDRTQEALPVLRDIARIQRDGNETIIGMQNTLSRFARAFALERLAAAAAQLLSSIEPLLEKEGSALMSWLVKYNEDTKAMIRNELDEDAFAEACEQGAKLTLDDAVELALASLD